MGIFIIANELIKISALLYCLKKMVGKARNTELQKGMDVGVLILCFAAKFLHKGYALEEVLVEAISLAIYVWICYSVNFLSKYIVLYMLYVIFDLSHLLIVIIGFPIMSFFNLKQHTIGAELLILILQILLYAVFIKGFQRINLGFIKRMSRVFQAGMLFIFATCQYIMLEFREIGYSRNNIMVYRILLFIVIFGILILVIWSYDKFQEQKKMQELTAYSHHTREIIPSVGRALEKIGEMSEHMEQVEQIISELRIICEEDGKQTSERAKTVKSFISTGVVVLDLQLERYLEEAEQQEFTLDIIVCAPMKDILKNKKIELYALLQIVGDLYRNANKVVTKNETRGRILMCFGYNQEGDYELSVYDNGEPFPSYVLEHLGERGVTTDGTGHGLSDIFESVHRGKMSFLLNQSLPKESIFTKEICITFDGKEEINIPCR